MLRSEVTGGHMKGHPGQPAAPLSPHPYTPGQMEEAERILSWSFQRHQAGSPGLWLLASGFWPLASGFWPLASGLGTARHNLSVAFSLQRAAGSQSGSPLSRALGRCPAFLLRPH